MHSTVFASFLLSLCVAAFKPSIPRTTGSYHVALTQHVLNKTTLNDPFAPNGTGTSILLNIYYPTLQAPNETRPYIDLGLAELYEAYFNFTPGMLSNITTNIQFHDAPTLPANESTILLPTLLFDPPFAGPPSQCFTALLSDLCSHGYIVVATDHPYEQPFLQYPYGGPGITGLPVDFDTDNLTLIDLAHQYRLSDTVATIKGYQDLVELYQTPFNTTHFVLFGHSLGGSAALNSLLQISNPAMLGAINLDGSILGQAASNDTSVADAKKPVLLMGSEAHNNSDDPTWGSFTEAQTGWWRELQVHGTIHTDYSDTILWKQWYGLRKPGPDAIDAKRMVSLVRTYVGSFFNVVQGKRESVLERPTLLWPEVKFLGGGNGKLSK